jgi:hypothetical protein
MLEKGRLESPVVFSYRIVDGMHVQVGKQGIDPAQIFFAIPRFHGHVDEFPADDGARGDRSIAEVPESLAYLRHFVKDVDAMGRV